jgi:hypothetical protein
MSRRNASQEGASRELTEKYKVVLANERSRLNAHCYFCARYGALALPQFRQLPSPLRVLPTSTPLAK